MGMFNWVDHECVCQQCHGKVEGFQTKEGEHGFTEEGDMLTVQPESVNNFYSSCEKCGCWTEFNRIAGNRFRVTVEGKKEEILHTKDVNL